MQTWLVEMRWPREAMREMGLAGLAAVQRTLGAAMLSALLFPGIGVAPVLRIHAAASYAAGAGMTLAAPG